MTKPMMDLKELVEKSADADLLGDIIGFAAEILMQLEVGAKTGADDLLPLESAFFSSLCSRVMQNKFKSGVHLSNSSKTS